MSPEQLPEPEQITTKDSAERTIGLDWLPSMRSVMALDFPSNWKRNEPQIPADVDDN